MKTSVIDVGDMLSVWSVEEVERGGSANLNSWDKWIFRATAA